MRLSRRVDRFVRSADDPPFGILSAAPPCRRGDLRRPRCGQRTPSRLRSKGSCAVTHRPVSEYRCDCRARRLARAAVGRPGLTERTPPVF